MKTTAIVLAAGKGSRMHADIPKQYMEVAGQTILGHCVDLKKVSLMKSYWWYRRETQNTAGEKSWRSTVSAR